MKNKKTGTNLADIANQLGLSTCTVSLALRNSTRISQATRQRVFKKAEDLKYFPNLQARSLRTQTTRRIGVILPELDNPFFVEKLGTMHDIARDNDYELTFACSYWDDEKERKAVEHFLIQRADALIISALSTSESLEHLHPFVGSGRPVCVLGYVPELFPGLSSITYDRQAGMYQAVKLLLNLGHRRIGSLGIQLGRATSLAHMKRKEGLYRALHEAGLNEDAVIDIPTNGQATEHGYEAVRLFLEHSGELPTAIITLNDTMAIGVLSALHHYGIRVPEDMSIVGFDNIKASAYTVPPLTTVSQKPDRLGRMAMELILEQLNSGKLQSKRILHQPELLVRQTTGPAKNKDNEKPFTHV